MKQSIFFLLLIFLSLSCAKKQPQLPANKGEKVLDKEANALLGINQTMANREDSILLQYVSELDSVFEKNKIGFWYRIASHEGNDLIKEKTLVNISYQVYSLDNSLLLDSNEQNIEIGKKKLPIGLEEGLKLMQKGESATLIVPWYIAYGMKGKANVASYTSVIFKVAVEKE